MPDEKPPVPRALRWTFRPLLWVGIMLIGVRFLNAAHLYPGVMSDESIGPAAAATRDDVREISFATADDVKLYGWVLGADSAPIKIIQFMGNGEFVGPGAEEYARSCKLLDAQFLLFDWRGFANSEGRPSEAGLYADARAAWRYALSSLRWKREQIVLWGRSLGGAPAIKLCSELCDDGFAPRALILEAPFESVPAMAREVMPFLGKPDWLVYELYDNIGRAPKLGLPVFHMHSTGDEIIPFEQGRRLHEALPGPKEFMQLEGIGHNETWDNPKRGRTLRLAIKDFLERHP